MWILDYGDHETFLECSHAHLRVVCACTDRAQAIAIDTGLRSFTEKLPVGQSLVYTSHFYHVIFCRPYVYLVVRRNRERIWQKSRLNMVFGCAMDTAPHICVTLFCSLWYSLASVSSMACPWAPKTAGGSNSFTSSHENKTWKCPFHVWGSPWAQAGMLMNNIIARFLCSPRSLLSFQ